MPGVYTIVWTSNTGSFITCNGWRESPPTPPAPVHYKPGERCPLGQGIPNCIDDSGDGVGVYLINGDQCIAATGPASPNLAHEGPCTDIDGDGVAGVAGSPYVPRVDGPSTTQGGYAVTQTVVIRSGASSSASPLGTVPQGVMVVVQCKASGEVVKGRWGSDQWWDQISYNGTQGYVADEWVDTKQAESDPTKVPLC